MVLAPCNLRTIKEKISVYSLCLLRFNSFEILILQGILESKMEIHESIEKSPPVCFVLGRWAFFLVIKTIILMTLGHMAYFFS